MNCGLRPHELPLRGIKASRFLRDAAICTLRVLDIYRFAVFDIRRFAPCDMSGCCAAGRETNYAYSVTGVTLYA